MELTQFKVRSFVIGLIVLGVIITLASWGISRIYYAYTNNSPTPTIVNVSNPTPNSKSTNRSGILPTPAPRQNRPQATPTARPAVRTTPTPTPQTNRQLANQPTTGPDDVEVKNPGISIHTPKQYQNAGQPIWVTGTGNVTSEQITLEVLDQDGFVLGESQAAVCYGLEACYFETSLSYIQPQTNAGYLYAYTINSLGEKDYEVLIPLTF